MSIAPILAAATQPAPSPVTEIAGWVVLILLLPGLAAAVYLRVYRPDRAAGPLRVPPGRPVWPLLCAWLVGGVVWLGASTAFVAYKQFELVRVAGPSARFEESLLTPADWAVISTVPPLMGFVTLLAGDLLYKLAAPAWLGFDWRRLGRGVRVGLVGAFIAVPWTFVMGGLLERVYQRTGFKHPTEHDLLRVMKTSRSPAVELGLVFGAVVVAPLFEELLFRGHLQTLIRQGLVLLTHGRRNPDAPDAPAPPQLPPPSTYPPVSPSSSPASVGPTQPVVSPHFAHTPSTAPPSEPHTPPMASGENVLPHTAALLPTAARAFVWQTWAAIVVTSFAFALVHPLWMTPIIFFLSLCLGYAYERTGNLWTTITMHATFNALNTLLYLYQ
jgi:membrane protease YdiL (CAAX protease family)